MRVSIRYIICTPIIFLTAVACTTFRESVARSVVDSLSPVLRTSVEVVVATQSCLSMKADSKKQESFSFEFDIKDDGVKYKTFSVSKAAGGVMSLSKDQTRCVRNALSLANGLSFVTVDERQALKLFSKNKQLTSFRVVAEIRSASESNLKLVSTSSTGQTPVSVSTKIIEGKAEEKPSVEVEPEL